VNCMSQAPVPSGQTIKMLESIAASQFSWMVLFLLGLGVFWRMFTTHIKKTEKNAAAQNKQLISLYKDELKKSADREERLMKEMAEQQAKFETDRGRMLAHLERTTDTLEHIEKSLTRLEEKTEKGFEEVWKVIETHKNIAQPGLTQ
jgi:DNA anti-recombination protein RmuC